jgi:hypothetical protein
MRWCQLPISDFMGKPLSIPKIAALAGYTARHMRTLRKLPDFPGRLANPGAAHPRYWDTPELRAWCAETMERKKLGVAFLLDPVRDTDLFSTFMKLKKGFFVDLRKGDTPRGWPMPSLELYSAELDDFVDLRDAIEREIERRRLRDEMNDLF